MYDFTAQNIDVLIKGERRDIKHSFLFDFFK